MAIPEPIPLAFFASKIACRVEMDMAPRRLQKGVQVAREPVKQFEGLINAKKKYMKKIQQLLCRELTRNLNLVKNKIEKTQANAQVNNKKRFDIDQ